ncbi:MAG: hypothetical protein ACYTFW_07700 [Planctomycetota bacterium]|jgi:hypothetical protein
MTKQDRFFKLFLRILGTAALLAVVAVVMPYSWMNAIHQWLGMGQLPPEPIVGYLARSTSAFYALLGGLLWVVSWDLHRHKLVLCYLGAGIILFGMILFAVDLLEGLPLYWSLFEGPINTVFGVVILALSYRRGIEPTR